MYNRNTLEGEGRGREAVLMSIYSIIICSQLMDWLLERLLASPKLMWSLLSSWPSCYTRYTCQYAYVQLIIPAVCMYIGSSSFRFHYISDSQG